ncbi:MAG: hypothetical protein LBP28_01850 [Coriobacteriales bacterium]|jgi:hypothetical protein|nr:hypothetical protein [Coriobacteriales bacterium]
MFFSVLAADPLYVSLLLSSNDDSSGLAAIPLLLCLSGFIYFGAVYARYRNSDKRHLHEEETPVRIENLQQHNQFVIRLTGLRNSSMQDRNDQQVEGALNESGGGFAEQLANVKDWVK